MTTIYHEALDFIYAHERWEAHLLLNDDAWETEDGLPHLTQKLYDELMVLQAKRNTFLCRVNKKGGPVKVV